MTQAALAKSNGIDIWWDSFGDRDWPAVLLIMGLACQMIAWDDAFCDRLAERGYRVIRFDNRDIGLSTSFAASGVPDVAAAFMASTMGRPVAAPYLLTDMTRDSIGLLDALAIALAHVVGLSMGGMIAQTMAIQRPERVASLTSIMSSTGEPGLPGPTPKAAAMLLKPAPVDRAAYIENFLAKWKLLRAVTFPEDEALDLELARRNFARGLNPAGVARQLVAILPASAASSSALKLLLQHPMQ